MCFREKIMAEVSGHISERVNVINVFQCVNLILYTVASIYSKTGILLEYYQYFLFFNIFIEKL